MTKAESEFLDVTLNDLGGLYLCLTNVMKNESPQDGRVEWYASGKVPLIDKFAGYSLSREQALRIFEAMQKVFAEKPEPVAS